MEEDTGKSLHVGGATGRIHGADYSLVDYNRAGIPLIEIVTKPIIGAGEQAPEVARAYVGALRDLLRGLGVSDVRMEQGSLRCDANLSLRPKVDDAGAGRRTARHPHRDQERQLAALGRAGGPLRDHPARRDPRRRRVDPAGDPALARGHRGHHRPGGAKSDAEDYRYFPEPDLVPVAPEPGVGRGAARRPCPSRRRASPARLQQDVGLLRPRDARRRQRRRGRAWSRRRVAAGATPAGRPQVVDSASSPAAPTQAAPTSRHFGVTPAARGRARRRWSTRARSTTSSPGRCSTACSPARARRTRSSTPAGWRSSPTTARSPRRSTRAIAANPDVAAKIRDGKVQAAGALIGAVMKEMRGQADAAGCAS